MNTTERRCRRRVGRTTYRHPVNQRLYEQAPLGARIADAATAFIGSWKFLVIQSIIVAIWIAGNIVLVGRHQPSLRSSQRSIPVGEGQVEGCPDEISRGCHPVLPNGSVRFG